MNFDAGQDAASAQTLAARQTSLVPQETQWAQREKLLLSSYATFAVNSEGRRYEESLHAYRSPFQRDRDRVLHSSAFRRLSGKMQVFTGDRGDYHRTRLTHTQEVATVARTIGRTLGLNEDLIEALALLHDIGHPPFGHSGEDALAECISDQGGFSHNQFALVLAEELETRYTFYPGLNLTREVLAGQDFRITHEHWSPLLEVQVVDLADSITYNAHDVDDALTLGLLEFQQLQGLDLVRRATAWQDQGQRQGNGSEQQRKSLVHSLIDVQVADLVESSIEKLGSVRGMDQLALRQLELELALSPVVTSEKEQLGQFLFENVYRHPELMQVRQKAATRIRKLWEKLVAQPQLLPVRFLDRAHNSNIEVAAAHYIAGMTDRFCDSRFQALIESNESETLDW